MCACFYVFSTVHHTSSTHLFHLPTLMHNSFIHLQYVCYITILDMFRASTCPSSGGKIILSQHLVLSLHTFPPALICDMTEQRTAQAVRCWKEMCEVTIPDAVIIQFVLLKMDMLMLEICQGL
jgi:hypothetical protein